MKAAVHLILILVVLSVDCVNQLKYISRTKNFPKSVRAFFFLCDDGVLSKILHEHHVTTWFFYGHDTKSVPFQLAFFKNKQTSRFPVKKPHEEAIKMSFNFCIFRIIIYSLKKRCFWESQVGNPRIYHVSFISF